MEKPHFGISIGSLMTWLFKIWIFAVSVVVGLTLGGFVPKSLPPSWRLPAAAVLITIGVVLAVIGFS
jgi:hypothetical protein